MIKASSLYESIIATVIIATTIAVVSLILSNIIQSTQKNYAFYQLLDKKDSLVVSTRQSGDYKDLSILYKGYRLTSDFSYEEDIVIQTLNIYEGSKILKQERVVYQKTND